jgi:hypothetical protein
MDTFIAGVILIAAVAWSSLQALLCAVSLAPSLPTASIKPSASAETVASECAYGQTLIIVRDLATRPSIEKSAHGS